SRSTPGQLQSAWNRSGVTGGATVNGQDA
ncbi:MAG: hypothetical protein QOJ32_3347, partial [Frankiaceae bacterium]|nr:hypothetical protein [Frankiaceae bacterium]